jgi:hydrogenase maturation protein HypF
LAREAGLSGAVGNDPQGAHVVLQGPADLVAAFPERLARELPTPGRVSGWESTELDLVPGEAEFRIEASDVEGEARAEVLPDLDVCPDCLRELFDPRDRRYRYPFLNCTRCGPRYSVVLGIPYDRARTSLKDFPLCPDCRAEYENPGDRRFHAQPVACPACGPHLWVEDAEGRRLDGDPLAIAVRALRDGAVVAVKGAGGFHLACRADEASAVERLRQRKAREAKPFAVMVRDLEAARACGILDAASEAALLSPAKPIVLVPKRPGSPLTAGVAPEAGRWGLMLPSTPLHHLILADLGLPLVMTSGNPSGEPLCADNAEARGRLGSLAQLFLMHDRPVARRLDDSVEVAIDDGAGRGAHLLPLRRARGWVPSSLESPVAAAEAVLALGGELKSAVCVLKGRRAVLSEHLGELDNPAAFRNFVDATGRLCALLETEPRRLAADLHPLYAATRWGRERGLPLTLVQHHHAHIAACMAENGLQGRVIGIACDGTGYGSDATIWGGEILACGYESFTRTAHLSAFPLPGGDAAARDTWRPALGLLQEAFGARAGEHYEPLARLTDRAGIALVARRLEAGQASVRCSSLGRVFDAVAALLGFCGRNRFEAEAAAALQHAAESSEGAILPYAILPSPIGGGPEVLDLRPAVRALCAGGDPRALARGFHETVAALLAEGAIRAARAQGLDRAVLSGGCFANGLLLRLTAERLRAKGLEVFLHREVPCGDGGLALGQAVVAAARAELT